MIKKLFSTVFILTALILLAVIGLLFLAKSQAGNIIPYVIEKRTGYPTEIEKLDIHLRQGTIDIQELRISNPSSYPKLTFVDLKQLKTGVDLRSILSMKKDRLIIDECTLDINTLGYITNPENNNNVIEFAKALKGPASEKTGEKTETPDETPREEEVKKEPLKLLIRRLALRLDTIEVANYTKSPPKIDTYTANINLELTDVSDIQQVIDQIQAKLIAAGADFLIGTLMNSMNGLNINSGKNLLDLSDDVLKQGKDSIEENVKKTSETLKNVFDSFK